MYSLEPGARLAVAVLQSLAMALFTAAAVGFGVYTIACALGYAHWLVLPLQFGPNIIDAGAPLQIGVTLLATGLMVYLPTNQRVLALETSHRNFSIHMRDVARAYGAVHNADRTGRFELKHEFDAVKERIAYLRDHPDLGQLEPDVLEVAAQMSVLSRDLAEIYSDEKVDRARTFLAQRQEELETFNAQLADAKAIATDIQSWTMRVELEEDVARSELARLRAVLQDSLPELPPSPIAAHAVAVNADIAEAPQIHLIDRQAAE